MSLGTPAQGFAGKIGMGSASPVTNRFQIMSENFVLAQELINGNGVIGTRSHDIGRVRKGLRRVGGPISLQPNAIEWSYWLQYIMGGTPTGSPVVSYPLADLLPFAWVTIDRITKVFTYDHAKVDRAVIRGRQGEPLELELSMLAVDETVGNAGTFPGGLTTIDEATGPFIFSDMVMTIGGTQVTLREVELTIDNKLDHDRYMNSLTLTAVSEQDREIMMKTVLPYGDWSAIYDTGATGLNTVITSTNGGAALVFTMPALAFPAHSPNIPGRKELMLPIEGRAYRVGGSLELTTTLNVGP